MNNAKRAHIFFLSVFVFLIFVSCASNPKKNFYVSYSSDRGILHEVEKTRTVLDENPVEALVRARALLDNTQGYDFIETLYTDASTRVLTRFNSSVSAGNWSEALLLFRSLSALDMPPSDWTGQAIIENRLQAWKNEGNKTLANLYELPESTPKDEAPSSSIVAQMIKGTVTVWVDKGLRIENGVGYANRVIGSGFFIDSRGYLITNYHVIASEVDPKYEGYSRLYIKNPDNTDFRIPARVIGWDPVLDLALLKVEITPPVVFQLGTSEDLKIGNRIYAIGSPAGLEQTLTSGIVSAQKRRLLSLGDILQIDAPINHGNSGGPIIDEEGRVQAVVFAGIEPYEGLNFAIPVEFLRIILPALYQGGPVSHPWFGVLGKTVSLPGSPNSVGVSVVYRVPGTPVEIAGIPTGAVITAVNGIPVKSLEELQGIIIREHPGTIIKVTGIPEITDSLEYQTRDWFVMLDKRPPVPGELIFDRDIESRALLPLFGMNIAQVGATKKYTIRSIVQGSTADEAGFSEQDVIEIKNVDINRKEGFIAVQLYTKKRKSGYLESFIGLMASLDSPSYF